MKGDDETAAFYAHLGELCPPPEFVENCYADLFRDVREHCGRSWNQHHAVLVHDYYSNPWTSMSACSSSPSCRPSRVMVMHLAAGHGPLSLSLGLLTAQKTSIMVFVHLR